MKKELLSPVGNKESMYQAVQNGCDAIYLGGKNFGARKYAENFSKEELKEAILYCHLYGVKVYVTVNTLIKDGELDDALSFLSFLYQNEVDGIIMQDLGLIRLTHEKFPDLPIHASTQLHNHNKETILYLKQLGVTRCVLARELSLEEIKALPEDMEYEIFIHGALCISYSGQCLMSRFVLNRSGNRGECAGLCRLPYQLEVDGKIISTKGPYVLSPTDLNTLPKIQQLCHEPKIVSFKIEGRMKSPEYVGLMTRLYRQAIDHNILPSEEEEKQMKTIYHRGFTTGHLLEEQPKHLLHQTSSNHIGIPLGTITKITPQKIEINLYEDFDQQDGIRFQNGTGHIINYLYMPNGKLTSHIEKGNIAIIDNLEDLPKTMEKTTVFKTSSKVLKDRLDQLPHRTIPISASLKAIPHFPLTLTVTCGNIQITKTGSMVEEAKKEGTSLLRLKQQLEKIKDTPYHYQTLAIETNQAFVPIKEINALRREILEDLTEQRKKQKGVRIPTEGMKRIPVPSPGKDIQITVTVRNEEQLKACLISPASEIITEEMSLYEKYQEDSRVIYQASRITNHYPPVTKEHVKIQDLGGITFYQEKQKSANYFLNAYNHESVRTLEESGIDDITLSVELEEEEIRQLLNCYEQKYHQKPHVTLWIYGRIELMIIKYPLLEHRTKHEKIYLIDRNHKKYPVRCEDNITRIFHHQVIDKIDQIPLWESLGITHFQIDLWDEDSTQVQHLLHKISDKTSKNDF